MTLHSNDSSTTKSSSNSWRRSGSDQKSFRRISTISKQELTAGRSCLPFLFNRESLPRQPEHLTESANKSRLPQFNFEEREIPQLEILPRFGKALQIPLLCFVKFALSDGHSQAHQRQPCTSLRVVRCGGILNEQAHARVGAHVARVFGQITDEDYRLAGCRQRVWSD